jgi:hypothetical protein
MFVQIQAQTELVPWAFFYVLLRCCNDANVGVTTAVFFGHCSKCNAEEFGSEDASLMRGPEKYISMTGILRRHWKFPERFLLGLKLHCVEVKQ